MFLKSFGDEIEKLAEGLMDGVKGLASYPPRKPAPSQGATHRAPMKPRQLGMSGGLGGVRPPSRKRGLPDSPRQRWQRQRPAPSSRAMDKTFARYVPAELRGIGVQKPAELMPDRVRKTQRPARSAPMETPFKR